jgi:hypothetical protein
VQIEDHHRVRRQRLATLLRSLRSARDPATAPPRRLALTGT